MDVSQITESTEVLRKHRISNEQDILMNMSKVFDLENIIYATVWNLVVKAIDNNIPNNERRKYIHDIIDKNIDLWFGKEGM